MEEEAFFELLDRAVKRLAKPEKKRFVIEGEALNLLGAKSKSFLWTLRSTGKISYFQDPDHPKLILYDRLSIEEYLKSNTKSSF